MTKEELKDIITGIVKEIEEAKALAEAEADPTSPDEGEVAAKIVALEARLAEYDETLKALKEPVDPKLDAEQDEEPPAHKFTSTTHFFHDISKAGPTGRDETDELAEWRKYCEKAAGDPTQSAGVAEAGGYLVPVEYTANAWIRQTERSSFMQNAVTIPMTTKTLKMPAMMGFDESSNTYYGNVSWQWVNELVTATATDIELEQIELSLEKLTGMVYLSDEIMKWGQPAIMPLVDLAFDVGLNRALTRGFLRGTGAGQPAGVLDAAATIQISKVTNQTADTFLLDNMLDMQARLYSVDENPTGIWYAIRQLIPQIAKMTLPGGTASTPMFMTSALPELTYTLMGLPLKFSTMMSAIGDSGDILLIDSGQYFIGTPAGGQAIEQASSIHVQFLYGQSAFKFTTWIAGQPAWRTFFTPEFGDTMSPFIKLEAR